MKRPPSQLLLQLQNKFMLADAEISQTFKERHADPEKLSSSLNHHIQLVKDVAHQYFEQFPADYVGGIDALGKGLFKDLSIPLQGHFKGDELEEFKKKWMEFFDEEASRGVGVRSNIGLYQQNGVPKALTLAIENILEPLSEGIEEMVPEKTANEVVKFLQAFGDTIGALGESWACYETDRDPEKTVQNLDNDITDALDQVLPEHKQTKEARGAVKKNTDAKMEGLSKNALQNQKMVAEGTVCKKETITRKSRGPSVCPSGWKLNGVWCYKAAALAQLGDLDSDVERNHFDGILNLSDGSPLLAQEEVRGLDDSITRKATGKGKPIPASCPNGWTKIESARDQCYQDCSLTMTEMDHTPIIPRCKTLCQGKFSASEGEYCGENPGVITDAKMKMVMAVWKAIVSVFKFIFGLEQKGIQAESLKGMVDAFKSMDGPFNIPKCSQLGLR